jgi:uncharacterized protein YhjY with autotransporter beta-barrel domain
MLNSYFNQCTGMTEGVSVGDATPEKVRTTLDSVNGTPLADVIVGLVAKCNQLLAIVDQSNETTSALQTELNYVLADWNSLVAASGSRTNGGAVGYVAQMRTDLVSLKKENNALHSQLVLLKGVHVE